ncbi:transcription antitermination factor NusB [Hydrotalea sandarakina]|jgi:N utilization substance protein B|uniref:NusB antitermination factor n=1 Tax=Hydrotalea sandarakina TaxID=1004304 RepID=A0A2W7RYF5_9BACT|nr:transcription antitermination factor NusB [Hydrotalea sandarakina]PZX65818.1 NusB antitermination factor [Hydrotalea sandarakina]
MISRRNIRVKVMQLLYVIESSKESENIKNPVQQLENNFKKTSDLFVYIIYFLSEVAKYAEQDARIKANKHITTVEDLNVSTKIAGNTVLWQILELPAIQHAVKSLNPATFIDTELVRKLYLQIVNKPEYKTYIAEQSRDIRNEKSILLFMLNECILPNEDFETHVEDVFPNWQDDGEMIMQFVAEMIQKPAASHFPELLGEEKWKFAKELLLTAIDKKEVTLNIIKPKLNNWDMERIALLDMIIMRLGVCEFLFFETIPVKVTINEYIDIAKEYSTPQSGQFVNGILDAIHKDLANEGKIEKVAYKPGN